MAASKITRNKDYSDDASNNAGGRDTVDCAGLDGEIDEIVTVTDAHADDLDVLLRDDGKMQDDILEGHEFSAAALAVLQGLINTDSYINYRQDWVTATDYIVGDLATESGKVYFCLVAHNSNDYASFAAALAAAQWHLFVDSASAGFPASPSINEVLYYDGGANAWGTVSALMAPLHALIADTILTGVATVAGVKTGKVSISPGATASLDFDAGPNQDIDGQNQNVTISTANLAAASGEVKFIDLRIVSDGLGAWTLTFPSAPAWTWLTDTPGSLASGKSGFLSLRCYGTTDADVVASWVAEA